MSEPTPEDVRALVRAAGVLGQSAEVITSAMREMLDLLERARGAVSAEEAESLARRMSSLAADLQEQGQVTRWLEADLRRHHLRGGGENPEPPAPG